MRKWMRIIHSSLFVVLMAAPVWARSISYPGGWSIMQMNDEEHNALHVFYSLTQRYSFGYNGTYLRGDDKYQTHSLQLNNLLKRWNNDDSQANLYWQNAIGVAYDQTGDRSDQAQEHLLTSFAMDWENRRYYTAYENEYHYSGSFGQEFMESIKLGVTPYIGEYGDLHTWLMVKVTHEPEAKDNFYFTPMLRFFKGTFLMEIGYSEHKELLLNFDIIF